MRHHINELYQINGRNGLYTLEFLTANNIKMGSRETLLQVGYATHALYLVGRDMVKVYDIAGIKNIYMYGEKTWFDSKVERDAYRIQEAAKRAEIHLRTLAKNELVKMINNMSIEEVKEFMEKMGLW